VLACVHCGLLRSTAMFTRTQLSRWGSDARCMTCQSAIRSIERATYVAAPAPAPPTGDYASDDDMVGQCWVCGRVAKTDEMIAASTDPDVMQCFDCASHNDWCTVCEQFLDDLCFPPVPSEPRVCVACQPVFASRRQLKTCSQCAMRLDTSHFSRNDRRCNTCMSTSKASSSSSSAVNSSNGGESDTRLCIICCARERDCTYKCWHLVVCCECSLKLDGCPVCREPGHRIPLLRI